MPENKTTIQITKHEEKRAEAEKNFYPLFITKPKETTYQKIKGDILDIVMKLLPKKYKAPLWLAIPFWKRHIPWWKQDCDTEKEAFRKLGINLDESVNN